MTDPAEVVREALATLSTNPHRRKAREAGLAALDSILAERDEALKDAADVSFLRQEAIIQRDEAARKRTKYGVEVEMWRRRHDQLRKALEELENRAAGDEAEALGIQEFARNALHSQETKP